MLAVLFWLLFLVWLLGSLFLILVILNQEPKGGGVGGIFAQGSALGESLGISGMQRQLHVLTKNSAIAFFVLSIVLAVLGDYVFRDHALGGAPEPEDDFEMLTGGMTGEGLPLDVGTPGDLGEPIAPAPGSATAPAPAPESAAPAPTE